MKCVYIAEQEDKMGSPLTANFMKLWKKETPDKEFFVPLLRWCSAYRPNIELCQRINRKFYKGNQNILIRELALGNTLRRFIAYPKGFKDDKKLDFFFNDICKFYEWSFRELKLNINNIDLEELKPIIAKAFGYDNKQRKLLGLEKISLKNFI